MQASVLLLILASVGMSAAAQIVLKTGMGSTTVASALAEGGWARAVWVVALNPWVVGGLAMYFFSAVLWLAVLARVQVSLAYPFVGLGFILTLFLGWWLMGDTVGPQRIVGTVLVVAGVVLIARGG